MRPSHTPYLILVLGMFIWGCTPKTLPSKSNVLSGSHRSNRDQQTNQTVFQPAHPKGTPSNQLKNSASNDSIHTIFFKPFISKRPMPDPSTLIYGSPAFYLYKTDSLQKAYSRQLYYEQIQKIKDQIAKTPDEYPNPAVNADNWYAAIDFNIRKPHFIILHHTAQKSVEQTLFTFSVRKKNETSAHYVIGRDGTVYQMLNDYVRSYHAGAGQWGSISDMNSCSLGIELDNDGKTEAFSELQISALIKLLHNLTDSFAIPTRNIIGHSDFAVGRKDDPSVLFPWARLAKEGFGYWYDTTQLKPLPAQFDPLMALRIIGYSITDPIQAIKAFKHHFIQHNNSAILSELDKKIIYYLMLQYK